MAPMRRGSRADLGLTTTMMTAMLFLTLCATGALATEALPKLQAVPFTQVRIRDRFWSPRQEVNRKATVEHSLQMLERAGNFKDLELAAGGARTGYEGLLFTDSDLFKVLEGIAYTLATHPDPKLSDRMDQIIAQIARAQRPDGYLNTWIQVTRPEARFQNLRDWHELYCAGHLFEAAVAHHRATGKTNLLDVAVKYADLIYRKFGPDGAKGYCGHPEIELALMRLWRETGDSRWFELGKLMIERRGSHYFAKEHQTPIEQYDGTYWLDDVPIAEHAVIKGHAVRAAYLMAGVTDLVRETGDPALSKMLRRVWRNMTLKRMFVTGGIGPSAHNEGFTVDYDLPNETAYQETCATIALALWGHRMALLHGDGSYMDVVETSLYNGLLSGVGLDGKSFFYVNPLANSGSHRRSDWFACACCPPNVLRTIASLGGYGYATSADTLYVNLFLGGEVEAQVGDRAVKLRVETDYPWEGKVVFTVDSNGAFRLAMRRPGWCRGVALRINGQDQAAPQLERGYIVLNREWKSGDRVELNLEMPVEQVVAHPLVKADLGLAAVRRGPLVYCMEQVDQPDVALDQVVLPLGTKFRHEFRPDLLGGVVALKAEALVAAPPDWLDKLYEALPAPKTAEVALIPYGFWANRAPCPMRVWVPLAPPASRAGGIEALAEVTMSFVSGNCQPWGVNDGLEPQSSADQPAANCHFWPHKGTEEWVRYQWKSPIAIAGVRVYWFDDTGRGECRLPRSWKLQALVNDQWQDIPMSLPPIQANAWNEVLFPTVTTRSLRLVVQLQEGWSAGILEWQVIRDEDS